MKFIFVFTYSLECCDIVEIDCESTTEVEEFFLKGYLATVPTKVCVAVATVEMDRAEGEVDATEIETVDKV